MDIRLHRNARTTPAIRRAIQQSSLSICELAQQFNLAPNTVRKWKRRPTDEVQDISSRPHNMRTSLPEWQEEIVVEIRKDLLLPLDDLLVCVREFIEPTMIRASLLRLLKRHGVNNLAAMIREQKQREGIPDKQPHKTFKDYAPGYLHVDVKYLPQMPDETSRSYLFVARDRATRWVHIAIKPDKSAASAKAFLRELTEAFPGTIHTILTDNGKEFTDRFTAAGERTPTGNHPFDQQCGENNIEHRLTKPFSPQTNGMVERFNGMIQRVIDTTRFESATELHDTLVNYCHHYNHHVHLRCLNHQTPAQAIKQLIGHNLTVPDKYPLSKTQVN
jgi:transposase InsO family protein/transposase-like protein